MTKQVADDDAGWWPKIKDWLSIGVVIAVVVALGWIFVLEGIHH